MTGPKPPARRLSRPARITGMVLGGCILFLLAGGMFSNIWPYMLEDPTPEQVALMLRWQLDAEYNPPTYYSALVILGNGLLLALMGWRLGGLERIPGSGRAPGRLDRAAWNGLALIFGALAVDEVFSLHERLGRVLGMLAGLGDASWILWVGPGLALALGVLAALRGALARLPRPTRRRFLRAGAIYVAGAAGIELLGAAVLALGGWSLKYTSVTLIEEFMEMLGQALFMVALVDFTGQLGQARRDGAEPNP